MTYHSIRIERDAFVTGTKGREYSRQSLLGEDAFGNALPHRVERIIAALGVLSLGARDLAAAYPISRYEDGFPSVTAARRWLERLDLNAHALQMTSSYLGRVCIFGYRLAGQRGRGSRVLVELVRHPSP